MAIRGCGFLLLSTALVILLGSIGAAMLGVATAPFGVVLLGLVGVVALGALTGAAWFAFRRAGRPLQALVDAAGRVEAGDYSVRVRAGRTRTTSRRWRARSMRCAPAWRKATRRDGRSWRT